VEETLVETSLQNATQQIYNFLHKTDLVLYWEVAFCALNEATGTSSSVRVIFFTSITIFLGKRAWWRFKISREPNYNYQKSLRFYVIMQMVYSYLFAYTRRSGRSYENPLIASNRFDRLRSLRLCKRQKRQRRSGRSYENQPLGSGN